MIFFIFLFFASMCTLISVLCMSEIEWLGRGWGGRGGDRDRRGGNAIGFLREMIVQSS